MALSVLDQSPVTAGSTPARALQESVALARRAERLGYKRYWLAEHHNTTALAGSAPEVLAARVASVTSAIRVGAGGILLSHHSAVKVAENFRVLEALFPGRIDLGLARADAGGAQVVTALQGDTSVLTEEGYRQRIVDLLGFLDDSVGDDHRVAGVRAMPVGSSNPEVWVLSSSSFGARLAAEVGLPLSFAHFVSPRYAAQTLAAYHQNFRPSCWCREPTASLAVSVICADTDAAAARLAMSDDLWHLRSNGGDRGPLKSVEDAEAYAMSVLEKELVAEHRRRRFVGGVERVHRELVNLTGRCELHELVVRTVCHDPAARIHSYELLAESFGIEPRPNSSAVVVS